jgi:hypothetical protein
MNINFEITEFQLKSKWIGLDGINCEFTDTINVEKIAIPQVFIAGTVLCQGDTLQIDAQWDTTFRYFWNDIEGTNSLVTTSGGLFQVAVQNKCGIAIDTFFVKSFPKPDVKIITDTEILWSPEESRVIYAGDFDSYIWQDGSTESTNTVYYEEALTTHFFILRFLMEDAASPTQSL